MDLVLPPILVQPLRICSEPKYLLLEAGGQSVWKHSLHLLQWNAVMAALVAFCVVGLGR